jgi:ribosomal protein RSM22 (predicted rRNA methylase)
MVIPRSQGKQVYYDARKSTRGDLFPHMSKHGSNPKRFGGLVEEDDYYMSGRDEEEEEVAEKMRREFRRQLQRDQVLDF